jgi:hypothetical protein
MPCTDQCVQATGVRDAGKVGGEGASEAYCVQQEDGQWVPAFTDLFCFSDDEAFSGSGEWAASTAHGVDVWLVCATCGEEGDIRQPGIATRETLGDIRHQELRNACKVLGVQEPIRLGYRDSGWGDDPAQSHPQAFVNARHLFRTGRPEALAQRKPMRRNRTSS